MMKSESVQNQEKEETGTPVGEEKPESLSDDPAEATEEKEAPSFSEQIKMKIPY